MHGHGHAASANVRRALGQADRAVGVDHCDRGGGTGVVAPEPGGDAASPQLAFQFGVVVLVLLGGLQGLDVTHMRVHGSGNPARPLFSAVHQAEFQGVDTQLLGQFVQGGLHAECGRRSARRPVGCRFRPVDHHVDGGEMAVWNVILAHHALDRCADGRARESARFIDQFSFTGDQFSIFGCANLDLDLCARRRTRGLKYLGPSQLDLDRTAGLPGQKGCDGLDVRDALGAESAADLHGDSFDLSDRDAQEPGGLVADGELSLAAGPNGHLAVGLPVGNSCLGLDITLVNCLGGRLFLDDHIGVFETLFNVAQTEFKLVRYVRLHALSIVFQDPAGSEGGAGNSS